VTEAEWLACSDPTPMLEFLRGKASDRKLRWFACACCRRIWHLLPKVVRKAVLAAERCAEGLAGEQALRHANRTQSLAFRRPYMMAARLTIIVTEYRGEYMAQQTAECVSDLLGERAVQEAGLEPNWRASDYGKWQKDAAQLRRKGGASQVANEASIPERVAQASLLRDICGNPFRPLALDPSCLRWNDRLVVRLAQAIYDGRSFQDLPVLADALEEAGCADPDILGHCRGGGGHVRGCWVVDAILGKR
jgi:hypothetical protein